MNQPQSRRSAYNKILLDFAPAFGVRVLEHRFGVHFTSFVFFFGTGPCWKTARIQIAAVLLVNSEPIMAWTKTKTAISAGIGVLLLAGIVAVVLWPRDPQKRAIARGERMVEKQTAALLDLTSYRIQPVSDAPSGFQVLDNVPLQIDGMICLWGKGAADKGWNAPEEIVGIPVNQRFDTLYVYHGAYYRSDDGTPVCEVVLRYTDGTSATNQLAYGVDILDWFANGGRKINGPSGPNSKLAWTGQKEKNDKMQQLRYCMTAFENPEPKRTVETIDLYSCKSRTVTCILAMTCGPSGLMKDAVVRDDREK